METKTTYLHCDDGAARSRKIYAHGTWIGRFGRLLIVGAGFCLAVTLLAKPFTLGRIGYPLMPEDIRRMPFARRQALTGGMDPDEWWQKNIYADPSTHRREAFWVYVYSCCIFSGLIAVGWFLQRSRYVRGGGRCGFVESKASVRRVKSTVAEP